MGRGQETQRERGRLRGEEAEREKREVKKKGAVCGFIYKMT